MAEIRSTFQGSGRYHPAFLIGGSMGLNLKSLIGKLNHESRSALEAAAGLCVSRTHYDIEIEHYLTKLLDSASGDFAAIIKHFEIDKSRLTGELARSLDKLKYGNAAPP